MKNKCILTDADGVLFDWEYAFDQWMKRHGYKVVETGNYQMNIKYGLPKDETMRLVACSTKVLGSENFLRYVMLFITLRNCTVNMDLFSTVSLV
jgi:FMN phosphatase YigB (HAD superfamily)